VSATLRGVACFGLPAVVGTDASIREPTGPIAAEPLAPAAWEHLLADVERLRLTGFLEAAIERGALPVTDAQRVQVADRHLGACASVLQLERVLLRAASQLERDGFEFVVLKGTAHAHLLYPDPSWRLFGDNDVLVRTDDLEEVVDRLCASGYRRLVPEPTPGFDVRFGKGVTLRHPRGDELDVHRTLLFGSFGLRVDADELFASTTTFELGGRQLRALGPDTRLLHACYHAALGDPIPRLGAIRDVAEALAGAHDPGAVLEMAEAWGAMPVLARALELCRAHLGVVIVGPIATASARHQLSRRERRAVSSYVGARRSFAAKVVASLPYVDGLGAKLSLVRAAGFPDPALRRAVGSDGTFQWLQKGVHALRGRHDDG
jgi:hypothetical protein